jgi:O-succinylhomoserine sulfhydrylase
VIEEVLSRFGVAHTLVDGDDMAQWEAALRPETRMFFLETPSNPTLALVDLRAVAKLAKNADAKLIVDNAFATPVLQRPMEFGADIVVHSSTKYIDGQGRALGGVVLCDQEFLERHLQIFLRHTGPSMSPFNAWLHLKSLETLELRMAAHCANATAVADFLSAQRGVIRVLYPFHRDHPQYELARKQMSGGGGVVAFEIGGGKKEAFRFVNALRLVDISNNLGDAKSLVTHPATTTHQRLAPEARAALGIGDGMLRLSVGLEDPADLCEDIARALTHI